MKRILKRGLMFCIIGVIALGLVACKGNSKKDSKSAAPKTKTESSTDTKKKGTVIPKKTEKKVPAKKKAPAKKAAPAKKKAPAKKEAPAKKTPANENSNTQNESSPKAE